MNDSSASENDQATKDAVLSALRHASAKLREAKASFKRLDSPPAEVRLLGEEVADVLTRVNEQRDQVEGEADGG